MTTNMNSKEALFALDTTFDEDMASIKEDTTSRVIKHINSTPKLYKFVKENADYGMSIQDSSMQWAKTHGDEFGDLFITELDIVDWEHVARMV